MSEGYVKIWRKLQDNPMWLTEKFTRGQAWIDLIMLANHKDGFIRKRGLKVPVKRGEVGWSELALAERWQWSRGKVRRFLKELKMVQQIGHQKNNVTSLINLLNYDDYQGDSTTEETTDGHQTDTKRYRNKNDKNEKNNTYVENEVEINPSSNGKVPYQEMIDAYHEILPELAGVRKLTDKRKAQVKKLWMDKDMDKDMDRWRAYLQHIRGSKFLMGCVPGREWQADFEWITNYNNFVKIIENKYHK
jgi:hypothetical protein